MSWENLIKSELCQKFGVSVVFIAVSYLVWLQMNVHINGRFASQDARIEDMHTETRFLREYIDDEQEQRQILFTAIEAHLKELTRRRPVTRD